MCVARHQNVVFRLVVLLVLACSVIRSAPAQDRDEAVVPLDTCIVKLSAPEEATVEIDGQDYGTKREFTFDSLEEGVPYQSTIEVGFPEGAKRKQIVQIKGGETVCLRMEAPEDTGILELDLPEGASVTLEGEEYGERRRFSVAQLEKGRWESYLLEVAMPDGAVVKRNVLLRGGTVARLSLGDTETPPSEIVVQGGHTATVHAVDISADGHLVVTGAGDSTAIIWDADTGRLLRRIDTEPTDFGVVAVAFSSDARRLATGDGKGRVLLWDVVTGTRLCEFYGNSGSIDALTFSHNGKYLVAGAILWEVATGAQLHTFVEHDATVNDVAFTPDDRTMLTGDYNKVIVWDFETRQPRHVLRGHRGTIYSMAVSPDGRHVVTCSGTYDSERKRSSGEMLLTDLESGQVRARYDSPDRSIRAVAFEPNGRQIIAATYSYEKPFELALHDAATLKFKSRFQTNQSQIKQLHCGAGDRVLGLAGEFANEAGVLWNIASGKKLRTFRGDARKSTPMAISPDGRLIVSRIQPTGVFNTQWAVIWELSTGHIRRVLRGHEGSISAAAFSPDGRKVITAGGKLLFGDSGTGEGFIWDVATGQKLFSILGHKHMIRAAAFSPDGRQILTASGEESENDVNTDYFGHMILTSADTGRKIREFTGHWHYVDCLAFTPKGERIATGGRDGTTIIWDAVSGKGMRGLESQDRRNIVALAFSPDGSQLLTGAEHWNKPSEAVLWDHAAGEQQRVAQVDGKVTSVSFSPDGQLFAAATRHRTYLYQTATGERLRTMVGSATLFTPDGQWMLGDGRIYDVATGELSVEIVRFGDGDDWLAVTEEGLLDGTPAALKRVGFRIGKGLEVADSAPLWEQTHVSGLLAEIGVGRRPLPAEARQQGSAPLVRIISPEDLEPENGQLVLDVEVVDQGGGVDTPWLWHGSGRVEPSEKPEETETGLKTTFKVALLPGENRLEIHARDRTGLWHAIPVTRHVTGPEAVEVDESETASKSDHLEMVLQGGHAGRMSCAALSPDGHWLITGAADRTAILWETATGRQIRVLRGHTGYVSCVAFSPDSQQIVTGSGNTVFLWQRATGVRIRSFGGRIDEAAFSPDGKLLLTRESRGAQLWEVASGKRLQTFSQRADLDAAVFSRDGQQVITAGSYEWCLWDAHDGSLVKRGATERGIQTADLSPDGRQLLLAEAAGANSRLTLWDIASGKRIKELGAGIAKSLTSLKSMAFSPDGRQVLLGAYGRPTLWNVDDDKLEMSLTIHAGNVDVVSLSPDGRLALTAVEKEVYLWDAVTGRLLHVLRGHPADVESMKFSPDGKHAVVLTRYELKTATLWNTETGKQLLRVGMKENGVWHAEFSPDGHLLVTDIDDDPDKATLWDVESGRSVRALVGRSYGFNSQFSPDGRLLLTTSGVKGEVGILWDPFTGERMSVLRGEAVGAGAAAFSPDGRQIYIGGGKHDEFAELTVWDVKSGAKRQTIRGHNSFIKELAVMADGSMAVSLNSGNKVVAWDLVAGRVLYEIPEDVEWFSISATGRRLVTCHDYRGDAIVWDTRTGRRQRTIRRSASTAAFSGDGRKLITGHDRQAAVWDLEQGTPPTRLLGHVGQVRTMAYAPNGRDLLVFGDSEVEPVLVWDTKTRLPTRRFPASVQPVTDVAFGPNGRQLITTSEQSAVIWDINQARPTGTLVGHGGPVQDVLFHSNGQWALSLAKTNVYGGKAAVLWDVASQRELRNFELGDEVNITCLAFSPDGRLVVTGGGDSDEDSGELAIWNVESGERVRTIRGHKEKIQTVTFSPDGQHLATGAGHPDRTVCIWDVDSGKLIREIECKSHVTVAQYSPDGRFIAADSSSLLLLDASNGERLRELGRCTDFAFSPDSRHLVTISSHGETAPIVRETSSGRAIGAFRGHTDSVTSVAFSPDGRLLLTGSKDGTARLWDFESRRELLRLVSLSEGKDWLVLTGDGLFDGSPGGRELVSWRVPGQEKPVSLDRFFQDFYHPGLLATALGNAPPEADVVLGTSLPPSLKIISPKPGTVDEPKATIEVEAVDQGGGVAQMAIYQNGARVLAPGQTQQEGNTVHRTFEVSLIEGYNHLRVAAASADGSWEAEPVEIVLTYEEPLDKSELHVLTVGASRYADANLNLDYAARDARAVAELFRQRGNALYAGVHVTEVVDEQATRKGIKQALKEVTAVTKPQDTLVVFLAGHGAMVGQRYYFVTHELRRQEERLENDIRKQGLPADEISDYLGSAKALKRLLILDTCASGGALGPALKSRSGFALRGAIERLSRTQGVFTIAASAATEEAQESKELGHGVLSYALLAGLKAVEGGPLDGMYIRPSNPERVVDVMEWFSFAAGQVPRLTEKLYGASQDVQMSTQGTSFPVLPLDD